MKTYKILAIAAVALLSFTSCDDNDTPNILDVEADQVSNLYAPQVADYTTTPITYSGDFIKFDFSTATTTESDTDWDIAFRGTTILVNGGSSSGIAEEPARTGNAGAYIVDATFADVASVTEASFLQDSADGLAITTGSGNGWYDYDFLNNAIAPIAGKVIVFRTADNHYAKVEILSYYKDLEDDNDVYDNPRYYTFNYVYQPNDDTTTFE